MASYTEIITDAMVDAGLLQSGDTPTTDQFAVNLRRLTAMINFWQTQGLKLWLNRLVTIPLVAGTATYLLGPGGTILTLRPLRVLQANYLDANTPASSRPLDILAWADYLTLGQRTQTGTVNSVFVNKQQTNLEVTFWPVPDAQAALGTAQLLVQVQVTNSLTLSDTLAFPIEWELALRWGLADQLATGQPETIMARCAQRAEMYRRALEDFDVEDAPVRFAPDSQQGLSYSRFL